MLAFSRFVLASSLVSSALAVVHTIAVGKDGLKFTPDSVNANPGDEVIFEFYPKNHTVTQSTLKDPCTAVPAGGDSGFMFVASTATVRPTKRIVVADSTTPLWFYCKQADHCSKGMVFAINPKSEDQMKEYRANALATAATTPQPAGTTPPATTTAPKVIPVTVGDGGALKFVPEQVIAAVGDTIQLTFKAGAHTFTQSTFADPCSTLSGGVDSGPKPAANVTPSPTFNFTVTDASKPLWFYCKTGNHCKSGMVFSINAPATGNTHEKYVANAKSGASAPAPATATSSTSVTATPTPSTPAGGAATGKEIPVTVGKDGLTFTPSSVPAAVGDTIVLSFVSGAHTFTQSSFTDPCKSLDGGVDSGPMPAAGLSVAPTFNYTVTDASKPLWFYCKTGNHCTSGMVFSINAPATGNTHEKFVENAKNGSAADASTSASQATTPPAPAPTGNSVPPSDSSSAPSTSEGSPVTPEAPNASNTPQTNTTPGSGASGLVASTSSVLFAAVLAGLLL